MLFLHYLVSGLCYGWAWLTRGAKGGPCG
jgi:hypothetical protein